MQVQVHTDNHIQGSAELTQRVEAEVVGALQRFGPQITRVEVHLEDTNSHKRKERDKRCLMEARLAGLDPIAASCDADTVDAAVSGAVDVLQRNLERTLDKLGQRKGRRSYSGDDVP